MFTSQEALPCPLVSALLERVDQRIAGLPSISLYRDCAIAITQMKSEVKPSTPMTRKKRAAYCLSFARDLAGRRLAENQFELEAKQLYGNPNELPSAVDDIVDMLNARRAEADLTATPSVSARLTNYDSLEEMVFRLRVLFEQVRDYARCPPEQEASYLGGVLSVFMDVATAAQVRPQELVDLVRALVAVN